MRLWLVLAASLLAGCRPAPAPMKQPPPPDPTTTPRYLQTVEQLTGMNAEAEKLFQRGLYDEAGAIVTKGQSLETEILSVPRLTLAATVAVSDLDRLYGRMLLRNRHYGWARLVFQKNVIRWKNWKPQTQETARRLKMAVADVDECDRRLAE